MDVRVYHCIFAHELFKNCLTGLIMIRLHPVWFPYKKKLFVAFPWVETSTGPGGFMICVFIV